MIARFSLRLLIALVILLGSLTAAFSLLLAPPLPIWGLPHHAHDDGVSLPLPIKQNIEQTFVTENSLIDSIVLWFDPNQAMPTRGSLSLTIPSVNNSSPATLPIQDIPPSGTAFFRFSPPVKVDKNQAISFVVSLPEADQRLHIKYQIDATKYPAGELIYHPNLNKVGDLAFHVLYRRPALGSSLLQLAYPLALISVGALLFILLIFSPAFKRPVLTDSPTLFSRSNIIIGLSLFIFITSFYAYSLIKPGTWIGPSDFSKELSYVTASASAIKQFSWPIWSHITCGGMSLLGNPEGTTLSLSTVLALLSSRPELALWLTLALEAGIACLGTYLLARSLGLSFLASIFSALLASLSPVYAYKIVEGIVMIGGALAFTPWALLGLHLAIQKKSYRWALCSGLALTAIFWRGDVHIILGLIIILISWSIIAAWRAKSTHPLIAVLFVLALFFVGASVKIIPYFEQSHLINSQVDPHSAQLTEQELWDDVFLKTHDRSYKISVLHGLPEHFGYFGAYVGLIPLTLALLGLLYKHKYKWSLTLILIITLVLADGALYEHLLRHIPPLSSLFRMPSRLLTLSVLLLSLLAGLGLQHLSQIISTNLKILPRYRYRHIISTLLIILIAFTTADLIRATTKVLSPHISQRNTSPFQTTSDPTLTPHLNNSFNDQQHASVLVNTGHLLPHLCGDQNNPPEFLTAIDKPTALSDTPTQISPNAITLLDPPANSDITIRARYVSSWQTDTGRLLPADDGSIHLITPSSSTTPINLRYYSTTIRSQQLLLFTCLLVSLLLLCAVRTHQTD